MPQEEVKCFFKTVSEAQRGFETWCLKNIIRQKEKVAEMVVLANASDEINAPWGSVPLPPRSTAARASATPLDDQLMLDPVRRRHWLLTKALEIAPLTEALALAREAEDFLSGLPGGDANHTFLPRARTSGAEPEAERAEQKSLSAIKNAQPMVTTDALVGLSSLVSIDEVIVYLQQAGDVLAEDQSADELLARANLKRTEQRLPAFVLLPGVATRAAARDKPGKTEKVTPPRLPSARPRAAWAPRPPSAHERAEWARRVIAIAD